MFVVDIYHDLAQSPTVREIRDVQNLREAMSRDISDAIAMRIFLVEDVTAPVIEILGGVYDCHPCFFRAHMQSETRLKCAAVDAHGYPIAQPKSGTKGYLPNNRFTLTETGRLPFFSLPFYRYFRYRDQQSRQRHESKRTMPRKYLEGILEGSLEERISGTFVSETRSQSKSQVGESCFVLMDFDGSLVNWTAALLEMLWSFVSNVRFLKQ